MNLDTRWLLKRIETGKSFKHIPLSDKLSRWYEELKKTKPEEIVKRWRQQRDDTLWGIYWWKIYVVWCETWWGKTTFINQVVESVSDQWWRVVRYSLEDRLEDSAKEALYRTVNRLRKKDWLKWWRRVDFVNNDIQDSTFRDYVNRALVKLWEKENIVELDKEKQVTIQDMVSLIEEEAMNGARVVTIDHLHYFNFSWDKRLDLEIADVMHDINEVARKFNIAIFLVAHYKNTTGEKYWDRPDPSYFKDAASIKQVANIIIQIQRDFDPDEPNPLTKFWFTKTRWPINTYTLDTTFNISTYEYDFTKSETSSSQWEV